MCWDSGYDYEQGVYAITMGLLMMIWAYQLACRHYRFGEASSRAWIQRFGVAGVCVACIRLPDPEPVRGILPGPLVLLVHDQVTAICLDGFTTLVYGAMRTVFIQSRHTMPRWIRYSLEALCLVVHLVVLGSDIVVCLSSAINTRTVLQVDSFKATLFSGVVVSIACIYLLFAYKLLHVVRQLLSASPAATKQRRSSLTRAIRKLWAIAAVMVPTVAGIVAWSGAPGIVLLATASSLSANEEAAALQAILLTDNNPCSYHFSSEMILTALQILSLYVLLWFSWAVTTAARVQPAFPVPNQVLYQATPATPAAVAAAAAAARRLTPVSGMSLVSSPRTLLIHSQAFEEPLPPPAPPRAGTWLTPPQSPQQHRHATTTRST